MPLEPLEEYTAHCPYCDEPITLLVDCSEEQQSYVEDCFVCCQPIVVSVAIHNDNLSVSLAAENE